MNSIEQPRLALLRSTGDCPLSIPETTLRQKFDFGYQNHQQLDALVFYLISWLKHTNLTTKFQQEKFHLAIVAKKEISGSWLSTLDLELLSSSILTELANQAKPTITPPTER